MYVAILSWRNQEYILVFHQMFVDKKVESLYVSLSEKKSKIYIERSLVSKYDL